MRRPSRWSQIDSLTVLSTDGASDVVKNATRTVTEATAAVKGLTGHRRPNLLASARAPERRRWRCSSWLARWLAAGTVGGGGRGRGGTPTAPPPAGAGPTMTHGPRVRRRSIQTRRSGEQPPTTTAPPPARRRDVAVPGQPRPATSPGLRAAGRREPEQRFARGPRHAPCGVPDAGGRARGPQLAAAAAADGVRRPARRPPSRRPVAVVEVAAAAAGVTRETQLDEAAVRLAEELRVIPGIERFEATRLGDLDRSGPRALRTLWRIARDRLDTSYGDMTIGTLIDRLNDRGPGGPSA